MPEIKEKYVLNKINRIFHKHKKTITKKTIITNLEYHIKQIDDFLDEILKTIAEIQCKKAKYTITANLVVDLMNG